MGSEVFFMRKAGRIILMGFGLVMMVVIFVLYGFVETEIPPIGYLGMWAICAEAVQYGAGEVHMEPE